MSQCWATHAATGIRCDRKGGHDGKSHRFQWTDEASTGYTSAATGLPTVAPVAVPAAPLALVPPPVGGAAPDAEGIENPTGIPAVTETDIAMAQRPVKKIVTPCVVCNHKHAKGTACSAKTDEGMDCGCLAAIPSNS